MACEKYVHEGDTILLQVSVREQEHFVYSLPPIRCIPNQEELGPVDIHELFGVLEQEEWEGKFDTFPFNLVGLYPTVLVNGRRILPNIHFMSFEVIPEHAPDSNNNASLRFHSKGKKSPVIYGQKIKLHHVASNTYLSLPTTQSSTSFVTLKATADESCLFFVQPLWKGKKIGETVCSQDEILLESVKYRGYCVTPVDNSLSASKMDYYPLLLSGRYEADTSYYKNGFVIHVHKRVTDPNYLMGGNVIRLSNMIADSYLCGEGSASLTGCTLSDELRSGHEICYVTDVLKPDLEHNREFKVGYKLRGRQEVLSSSAYRTAPVAGDCYWQVEKWDDPLDGSPFEFGVSCCLKHLPTQRYLAAKKDTSDNFELIQITEESSANFIFQFVLESLDDSKYVKKETFLALRIKNEESSAQSGKGMYLSMNKTRNNTNKIAKNLYKLEACNTKTQCVLRIKQVDFKKRLIDVYFVESIKNILMTLSMFLQINKEIPVHYLYILDAVANWLKEESYMYMRQKTRSKLLRTNHVIDLLVSCLDRRGEPSNDFGSLLCYVLEQFVKVPSRKSYRYFTTKPECDDHDRTSLLNALVTHIGCNRIEMMKVLIPLVSTDSAVAKYVVETLHASKPAALEITVETMEFFSSFCFVNDMPCRNMQDYICSHIQADHFKKCTCKEVQEVARSVQRGQENEHVFKFWVAQLKFFSSICKGSNRKSIDFVKKLISFNTDCTDTLIGSDASGVHPVFKSAYLEFLMSAYVDPCLDSSGSTIDDIWHCYYRGNLTGSHQPFEGSRVDQTKEPQIIHLIEIMNQVIQANHVLDACSENGRSKIMFLCDVMAVMKPIISYGYSWNVGDKGVQLQLGSLINILDGSSDRYLPSDEGPYCVVERYKFRNEYIHLFKLKTRVIELLNIYLKQLITLALEQFIFKFCCDQYAEDHTEWQRCPILNHLEGLFFPYRRRSDDDLYEYRWFNTSSMNGQKLVRILKDLMLYGDNNLRAASAGLLSAMYNKEQTMLEDAEFSYIVCEKDEAYKQMITFGTFKDGGKNEPVLSLLIRGTKSERVLIELDSWGDCMTMKNNETNRYDETKGNTHLQNIAFTSGIFSILMSYVLKNCVQSDPPELQSVTGVSEESSEESSEEPSESDTQLQRLKSACRCLQMMCRENDWIKHRMSKTFTKFLDTKSAASSVACLLTEVLTSNRALSESVKKDDVKRLYILAVRYYSEGEAEYLEFFTTLQALIKPFKSSAESCVAVHQHIVARLFLDTYENYFCEFMMKNQNAKRQELLHISPIMDSNKPKLLLLLHLTSLLATCCEGQLKFAQEICYSIFTFEELLEILISPHILSVYKVPFARLLAGAYLSTDKKSITKLAGNGQFWDVDGFIRATKNSLLQHSDPKGIRIHLRKLLTLHFSWSDVVSDVKADTDEKKRALQLKRDLQYLVEGLGPLVTVFCKTANGELAQCKIRTLQEIGNLIMDQLTGEKLQGDILKWHEECLQATASEVTEEMRLNEQLQTVVSTFQNRLTVRKDGERQLIEAVVQQSPHGLHNMELLELFSRRVADIDSPVAYFKAGAKETSRLCHMLRDSNRMGQLADSESLIHVILEMFGVLHTSIVDIRAYDFEQLMLLQKEFSESSFAEFAKPFLDLKRWNLAIHVLAFFCVSLYYNDNKQRIYNLIIEDGNFFRVMERLLRGVHASFNQIIRKKEIEGVSLQYEGQTYAIEEVDFEQIDDSFPLIVIDSKELLEPHEEYALEKEQEDSLLLANAALDAVSVLCYGQNSKMQRLLGNPNNQPNKTDFIREVAVLLQILAQVLWKISCKQETLISCTSKALEALIQMCSGHFVNQRTAMEGQVIDSINKILRIGTAVEGQLIKRDELLKKILAMQSLAVKLFDFLLQEADSSHMMLALLDINCLIQFTIDVYTMHEKELKELVHIPDDESDSDEKVIIQRNLFRAYHILRSLADHTNFASFFAKYSTDQSLYKQHRHMWDYLYEHTQSIELNYYSEKDDKDMLVRVYFPFHSSETFTEKEKEVFQANVSRDDLEDKHKDMLTWTRCALKNNKYKATLRQIPWLFPLMFGLSSQIRRWILVFLTIALNACVLALFVVPDSTIEEQSRNPSLVFIKNPQLRWPAYRYSLYYLLAIPHVMLSFWMVLEYFVTEFPNFLLITSEMKLTCFQLELWIKRNVRILYDTVRAYFLKTKNRRYIFEAPVYKRRFDIDLIGLGPLYRIVFLLCSILGATSISFGYLYCLCLPYVFIGFTVLQNIQAAVSNKKWQLTLFVGVLMAILWIYAVISFVFLYNFFDESQSLYCNSLLQCFVTVVRDGLLSSYGGAIPVTYVNQSHTDFGIFAWRAVIDISFYVLITLIVFPIVISIFNDSFNELRDKTNKMLQDQQSVCFICGIKNDRFEKDSDNKGSGFYDHTHNDHYVYSYIYYGIYVKRKSPKLYTTFEKYVCDKMEEEKFDFYPYKEAKVLQKKEDKT